MTLESIPFSRPYITEDEHTYVRRALESGQISGKGAFTKDCHTRLITMFKSTKALLTPSCTAALELGTILLDIGPGDEVIMPSYTFVSTANAVCLRGATPVFVDIRPDTLNIDENLIESAITSKTKAICPVHYAGVSCQMDKIMAIANQKRIFVYEDAAQAIGATFQGQPVGSQGHMASLSFHDTKNVVCGEGGALLLNDDRWNDRAEIVWEKGTDKKNFLLGRVDKYSWVDVGSSFLPSELQAAVLLAQLEKEPEMRRRRLAIWQRYHDAFASLEAQGFLQRPVTPADCQHAAHIYYVILPSEAIRKQLITDMQERGINCVHHYVPLHSSIAGRKWGRTQGSMQNTDSMSSRILRMPMWVGIEPHMDRIIEETVMRAKRIAS